MAEKQHNKNLRVNACILLDLLELPFGDELLRPDIKLLSMEWTGEKYLLTCGTGS